MSEPTLKSEHYAIFKQNYAPKLLIYFKMAYSCCFSLGKFLDFLDFLQKKFYSIDYRVSSFHEFMRTSSLSNPIS